MTRHLDIQKIIRDSFFAEPELALREEVNPRTLQRWVASGLFPEPVYIRKMRFYDKREVYAWERERKQKRLKKAAVRP